MYVDFNRGVKKFYSEKKKMKFESKDKLMYLNRKFYYKTIEK